MPLFVDYASDEAVVIYRALVFLSTVASVLRSSVVVVKDFLVMVVNDAACVRHATAAYFHVVLEKNSMSRVNEIK